MAQHLLCSHIIWPICLLVVVACMLVVNEVELSWIFWPVCLSYIAESCSCLICHDNPVSRT